MLPTWTAMVLFSTGSGYRNLSGHNKYAGGVNAYIPFIFKGYHGQTTIIPYTQELLWSDGGRVSFPAGC